MAVRSKEEIIAEINNRITEKTDEVITLIEDISDTIDTLGGSNAGGKDWKAEAERIDREWREKYITRFTSGGSDDTDETITKPVDKKDYSFDKLFKEGE